MISVSELMTPKPHHLSRLHSLFDARQLMKEKCIRHVPITDNEGRLIGLVSQRNVLANAVPSQDYADDIELKAIESGILLEDIMTKKLYTITPQCEVSAAAKIIHKHKVGCLPVVDKNNQLVGIITDHDFVAMTIHLIDLMNQQEPLELD